jgi:hypothetical protein
MFRSYLDPANHCLQKSVVFMADFGFICGRESRARAENFVFGGAWCCMFCGMGMAAALCVAGRSCGALSN